MARLTAREIYRRSASEYDECVAFVDWLRLAGVKFIHVQNEQSTTEEGRKTLEIRVMKQARIGVEADFPDYIIFNTPPKRPDKKGVVIEMKKRGKKARDGQLEWLAWMAGLGYCVGVFDSADDAITFLESLGFYGGIRQ